MHDCTIRRSAAGARLRSIHRVTLLAALALVTIAAGCETLHDHDDDDDGMMAASNLASLRRAVAVLRPTDGSSTRGMVTFEQQGSRVVVTAEVEGLTPNAIHAWHIHQYGDVSAGDGTATGGHYNPEGHPHALPTTSMRHAGDLGNLVADGSGRATASLTVDNVSIAGARNPILGRAIIVHVKADDGGQPTGNAGARIAQGVIGVSK